MEYDDEENNTRPAKLWFVLLWVVERAAAPGGFDFL